MKTADATILVIENESASQDNFCGVLEDAGYRVISLEKATDALELVREGNCDAIITDISLPDVSGLQVLEWVREINPEVAVIMTTGYSGTEKEADAVNQGAYACFLKPVNPEEIKSAIANALKQQRLSLENKRLIEDLSRANKLLLEANEELQNEIAERREKTEELKRANQLKSEFLANMSHELRTPLNAIIGFSELMVDGVMGKVDREQKRCLGDILEGGWRLLNLINGVLDLSRIESGEIEFKPGNIALGEVVASLSRTIMPILTQRKQDLRVVMEERLPLVYADESKLSQVLLNLVDNASKFSLDGSMLRVEAVREGDWCHVCVVDNGIGIKEKDGERVFEPFTRLDSVPGRERGGTGLGLALVKQIVGRHGGRIWVDSVFGQGSRFNFTLPLAKSAEPVLKGSNGR
ncbi:ATP-binding protein [Chloroflexota bacterium]